jgi:hypothetical protein
MMAKLAAFYENDHSHPQLAQAWEYVAGLHDAGGDDTGAANARKLANKCKSAGLKSRDASHKAKQLPRPRRR